MEERRLSPRRQTFKPGHIVRSGNGAVIECAVRNVSDGGACLQISVVHDLSTDFTLVTGDARRPGRVVWRTKDQSGIAFTRTKSGC
jgi:PilZ domain